MKHDGQVNGWLSPAGEFFPCDRLSHYEKAEALTGACFLGSGICDDILLVSGYVKVAGSVLLSGGAFLKSGQRLWLSERGYSEEDVLAAYIDRDYLSSRMRQVS